MHRPRYGPVGSSPQSLTNQSVLLPPTKPTGAFVIRNHHQCNALLPTISTVMQKQRGRVPRHPAYGTHVNYCYERRACTAHPLHTFIHNDHQGTTHDS